MEMRAFVLTFPLFSEYDLISKRKREEEAGRTGERRREEEDNSRSNRAKRNARGQ